MDRDELIEWIDRYERAWRSPGTAALPGIFTDDAVYLNSPYSEPIAGIEAIAAAWEAGRDGHDEVFSLNSDVVAVDGDTGVARVVVRYGEPVDQEYTDLWVVRFAGDRARHFEEWAYWPGASWTVDGRTD